MNKPTVFYGVYFSTDTSLALALQLRSPISPIISSTILSAESSAPLWLLSPISSRYPVCGRAVRAFVVSSTLQRVTAPYTAAQYEIFHHRLMRHAQVKFLITIRARGEKTRTPGGSQIHSTVAVTRTRFQPRRGFLYEYVNVYSRCRVSRGPVGYLSHSIAVPAEFARPRLEPRVLYVPAHICIFCFHRLRLRPTV